MADEKNPWTTAFEEVAKEKSRMSGDVERTADTSGYKPGRRKMIQKAHALGLTSEAHREAVAEAKKAARRAAYAAGKKGLKAVPVVGTALSLLDADELGAAERMPEELKSELNQMEEYKKGGLVGRGQGRAIKIKTTKLY